MDAPDSIWLQQNAAALASPQRCVERGVAGPFTTPGLFGARVRGVAGEQIEVVVPHPSGREGWFVLPWPSVVEAYRPSLMDRALAGRLAGGALTPARMRASVRAAAAEGLGGRPLRRAALAPGPGGAALPARVARVRGLVAALERWDSEAPAGAERAQARFLAARAAAALGPAQALATSGEPLGELEAERVDWLLDGWDLFAALWSVTPAGERVAALRRMVAVLPPVPDEMLGWPGCAGLVSAQPAPPRTPGHSTLRAPLCEAALAAWLDG